MFTMTTLVPDPNVVNKVVTKRNVNKSHNMNTRITEMARSEKLDHSSI